MSIDDTKERRFESDIESFFISKEGGYTKGDGVYDHLYAVYRDKLIAFVKETQPKEWSRFEKMNTLKPEHKKSTASLIESRIKKRSSSSSAGR